MIIAKVIGHVISNYKHERIKDSKILIVQPIGIDGRPVDRTQTTIDTIGPKVGDLVLLCMDGDVASEMIRSEDAPVRSCVVGIIDTVSVDRKSLDRIEL